MSYRIAVIGSGISGLVCAYLLSRKHDVHLFEANESLGGHTHTVAVENTDETVNIDCGFIVFNKKTYPNFTKLLELENIAYQPSEMSFSFYDPENGFYYNGHSLNSLFADKRNLTNPFFYTMLIDILKFNFSSKRLLKNAALEDITLEDYLSKRHYSKLFISSYLIPMISAIWSCPQDKVLQMPLSFLIQFYNNHGLLDLYSRPPWYVIQNGSSRYITKLIARFKDNIHVSSKVNKISRVNNHVLLHVNHGTHTFDKVIIATHSDEALKLLDEPSNHEVNILSNFLYQNNQITLHTDTRILPPNKKAWASWNYYKNNTGVCTLNYYANRLQSLKDKTDYIVSVNLKDEIAKHSIIREINFSHPIFSSAAIKAQQNADVLNGSRNTYFCGAYWGNGFHEDGVVSALKVCSEFKAYL